MSHLSCRSPYSKQSSVSVSGAPLPRRADVFCRWPMYCLALFALMAATKAPLFGQDKPGISVDVKVVNVLATVRDKKGEMVTNLGQDDFKLEEDGRPQTISYFSHETDLPLTLGLLVDTSYSQRRVLPEERGASQSFLDNILREGQDQAFLIRFDREVELLQDLTSSHQKLGGGPYGRRRGYPQPFPEQRPDGKKILMQISTQTGGRLFEVSKKQSFDQIYRQIEQELRSQYSLGYTPDSSSGLGYHKIHVTTKQKDYVVQARDGYYSDR